MLAEQPAPPRLTGRRWRRQRIAAVMRIETLRIWRDRATMALIVVVPAVQILLFGATVNLDPRGLTLAVAHSAGGNISTVQRAADATGYFRRTLLSVPSGSALPAIVSGSAQVAIEWSDSNQPQLLADASDAAAVRPATLALAGELQRSLASDLAGSAGISNADEFLQRYVPAIEWHYNPAARTTWSITPGLAGVVVMITMLLLGALTLVREREQGSWESLLATAVDGVDAVIGKLTPYVVLGVVQAAVVVACAHWIFDVPVAGSLAALLAAAALLATAHLLFGFALSALAASQLQAIQSAVFFYLPSMLLSGFMFPFEGMPRWAQRIGECIPLTHFVRVARGVMLRGAEASWVCMEMAPVAVFAAVAAVLALLSFRRHLN
jgi:ABC-2 type transport system permease protein